MTEQINTERIERGRFRGLRDIWIRMKRNRLAMVGLVIIIILIITAIFADYIAPYGYAEQNLANQYQTPNAEHWFGTDELGRDIFSRVVYGSRVSLRVGFISVSISMTIGVAIGAITGYYGGKIDNILMRFIDIVQALPDILLAIAIMAALGPGLTNLMVAVGIAAIPGYARLVRSSVLSLRDQEFVEAARANGSSDARIILKHIIPNCMAPIIVQATLGVAYAIINAAGLSFIGLGLEPPTPEWGAMLSGGRAYIRDYPHMTLFPGLAIVLTILALNLLGDGLRDALDPKLKR
ncbi:ABC transporter permease [Falseniella ignava]|uniref:ABC transporter permease n=1 Tax=Falseniella ignava TaxID=137730 RepID=A0A2I1K1E5_9LACT|nr:nickel transporter permease [Falseniella ignava]PKY89480.1 ABC transporter permease [Falseniella ignava]